MLRIAPLRRTYPLIFTPVLPSGFITYKFFDFLYEDIQKLYDTSYQTATIDEIGMLGEDPKDTTG